MIAIVRQAWSRFLRIGKPFFTSEVRWQAGSWLALLIGLLLALSGLNVVNSFVGRNFMTAITESDPHSYYWLAVLYLCVFAASTIAGAAARFTELRLGLRWREWLTRYFIRRYLAGHAYYRVNLNHEIDNPDQRISEDVRSFTTTSLSFLIILFSSIITVIAFAGILWSISGWLFLAALLYPAVGTVLAVLVGHRLVWLDNLQLHKEADFRYELVHVRQYADSLVLAHREPKVAGTLDDRLTALVDNYRIIINVLRNLKLFSGGYNYLTQLIPVMIVAPLYMSGEVEFGVVTQAMMAFSQVFNAFSLIVEQFQDISTFSAVLTRLASLSEAMEQEETKRPSILVTEADGHVAYQPLTLRAPKEGRVLIHDLRLDVPRGRRLLIHGLHGVGKSALFLATAGVWDWGEGRITRPPWHQLQFLPQQPFLLAGSLRDQVVDSSQRATITEERILDVLRSVHLQVVLDRMTGLDEEQDWKTALSLGEQQLLAIARLLLVTPDFAFLDNATSALTEQHRESVYQQLSETAITYISVGDHHPSMLGYHDLLLELAETGEWHVEPLNIPVTHSP